MNLKNRNWLQMLIASGMFIISVYMTISYGNLVAQHQADRLTTIALYVWIFSIPAWLIKLVYEMRHRKAEA